MKRGISLIAVLMFMLAATAASIVLFKWIGSENFLSGARLKQSEAYQASESGLDAVQAWLSYKAADAGSLIKEHLKSGNPKRSYQLNHPSNDVLGNFGAGNQNFEVYLIGADITSKPYKLKFLSIGKGRDNSEVRQTAIFNVEGLYITDIPHDMTVRPPGQPTEYNEDFWGNMGTAHSLQSMRMVMTQTAELKNAGGMGLNKITIGTANEPGYLILDGDYYTNNGIKVYGDTYVTGNYDLCSSGPNEITGNLYIGEAFHARISSGYLNVGGSAYFGGDVNPNSPPKSGCGGSSGGTITIKGNSTINGDFVYWNNGSGGSLGFNVEKNLVMDKGKIDLTRQTNNANTLAAEGNVYIANPLTGTIPSGGATGPIPLFGNTSSNTVCVSGMNCPNSGSPKTCTSNNIQMKTNANQTYDNLALCSGWQDWGADPMDGSKSDKDLLAKLREGSSSLSCENTPIKFDMDIYEAAIKNPPDGTPYFVHKTGTPRSCAVQDGKLRIDYPWVNLDQELKACWNTASSNNQLYNGEWLVVYLKNYQYQQPGTSNSPLCDKTLGKCKYIIIFDFDYTPPGDNFIYLPPTGDNAEVMIFLPKGSPHIISLAGGAAANNCSSSEQAENGSCWINTKYNYFIFSDGDIKQFNTTGNRKLTGNVFMNRCSIMNLPGVQGNPYFMSQGNTDLVAELTALRILLKNDGSGFTGGGGNVATEVDERKDNYIIPLSPRLKVELESKYISKEKPVNPSSSEPSVLVMPRVLRLPTNAVNTTSELKSYYNLLYLNWKAQTKPEPSSAPICINDNSTSTFPNDGAYRCTLPKVSEAPVSEFYVKIQNSTVLQDSDDPTSPAETSSSSVGPSSSSASLSSASQPSSSSSIPPLQAIDCDYQPSFCNGMTIDQVIRDQSFDISGYYGTNYPERCIFAVQVFNLGNHGRSCEENYSDNLGNYTCACPDDVPNCETKNLDWQYGLKHPMRVNGTTLIRKDGNTTYSVGRCGGNGQSWQISGDNELYTCSEAIARQNIQRVDGGYYVYLPPGWVNQNFQLAGGSPVCAGAASSSSGEPEQPNLSSSSSDCPDVVDCPNWPFSYVPSNYNCQCMKKDNKCYRCKDDHGDCNTDWLWKGSNWGNNWVDVQLKEITCPGTTPPPATITCSFPSSLSVKLGQNINAPTITCSEGSVDKSGASFSASTGYVPENSLANWKSSGSAYYATVSAIGNNIITVSGVKCGGNTVSGTTTCGSINVSEPTCSLNKAEYAVNETVTPTVDCGNATPGTNRTFNGTNWQNTSNANNTSGKFTTATTGSNTIELSWSNVTCDSHALSTPVSCGLVKVIAQPTPTITCGQTHLGCYETGVNVPRPTVSCGTESVDSTYFRLGPNYNDVVEGWLVGNNNKMYSTGDNRNIRLDRIVCSGVSYVTSLPSSCGTVSIGNCGSSTVTVIGKNTEQTIAANGGTITIKCNSDCHDAGSLICCTEGNSSVSYSYKVNNGVATPGSIPDWAKCSNTSFYQLSSSIHDTDSHTINNTGSSSIKCKFQ